MDVLDLYRHAEQQGIEIDWFPMRKAESLSVMLGDGSCSIAIDPYHIRSNQDEKMKLSHEIGHCDTGAFYNKYALLDRRQKQEYKANKSSIFKLMPIRELKSALRKGFREMWELAEYFDVPHDFAERAITMYRDRLGLL